MKLDFNQILNELPRSTGSPNLTLSTDLTIGQIISKLLPYIFGLAGIAMILYLIYGGFHYMASRGDPKGMQEAKGKITNAIIGFIIIFAAYWIVQLLIFLLRLEPARGTFGITGTNQEIRQQQGAQCAAGCEYQYDVNLQQAGNNVEKHLQAIQRYESCLCRCGPEHCPSSSQ